MSQTETPKAEGAEERTEEARSFVRRARTATRSKYTPEERIRIVLEGFRRGVTVSDLSASPTIDIDTIRSTQREGSWKGPHGRWEEWSAKPWLVLAVHN